MNQYTYFALGIVLGIILEVYYFMNREEKIESQNFSNNPHISIN